MLERCRIIVPVSKGNRGNNNKKTFKPKVYLIFDKLLNQKFDIKPDTKFDRKFYKKGLFTR
jgi:hypothetical protein